MLYTTTILPWRMFKAYYSANWGFDVVLWLAIAGGLIYWMIVFFTARFPRGQVVLFLCLCALYLADGFWTSRPTEVTFAMYVAEAVLPWRLRGLIPHQRSESETRDGGDQMHHSDQAGRLVLGMATLLSPIILLGIIMLRQGNVAGYYYGEADMHAMWWIGGGCGGGLLLEMTLNGIAAVKRFKEPAMLAATWGALFASVIAAGYSPQDMASFSTMEICFGIAAWGAVRAYFTTGVDDVMPTGKTTPPSSQVEIIITLCTGFAMLLAATGSMMLSNRFFGWLYNLAGLAQFWTIAGSLLAPFCVTSLLALELGRFPARIQLRKVLASRWSIRRARTVFWSIGIGALAMTTVPAGLAVQHFTNPVTHYTPAGLAIPALSVPSNYTGWGAMYNDTFTALASNLNTATMIPGLWAHPGGFYQTGWDWDTALISLVWQMLDASIAQELIVTYLTGAINPNGMVSHMYGPVGKSGYSQPPLLAWASWRIYQQTGDRAFLDRVYPLLDREFMYWLSSRDPDGNGVYSWLHRDESGLDDTPALPVNPSNTDAFDLTAWLALDAEVLGSMALETGNPARASYYASQRARLIAAVQDVCWDEGAGFFYNIDKETRRPIRVKTVTGFLALLAGIATGAQAARLVTEHLTNASEFWTPYPVPSTAANEPAFTNVYWRGPVWINMNYFTILGLQRYNFTAEARFLAARTLNMTAAVYLDRGYLYEYYNPMTGHVTDVFNPGGGSPAENFVGWSGLVAPIMRDFLA
ncbi:MAG: hypothetical protein GYA24_03380 [Candidatus Lokiarchaeota archaeon]|nr:hypothetical protein [Candidatus Lokiarchaeota archaeon]